MPLIDVFLPWVVEFWSFCFDCVGFASAWLLRKVRALGLMRIVRGMQRSFPKEQNVLGWKKTFSQGIGVTAPKARTRDKHNSKFGVL
ncbi:hypothetical protein GBA52_020623 [Prunus armeniaca]|nr:hypothetical protein GBA52_020623 [Prunus armeniaca]